ncbi:hypothetical protein HBI24_036470 [Parastagonospora nodorum]|nr:hypothetical protein HBH53_013660 [Parastagonospora nodorum]KAH4040371.1 hypothetical protein HBI09_027190 [Parastagonospora nodorum]KAH4109848.1 hypothetical protein HBH46_027850 [Parastagonospora nodorum]KAH4432537.1 hypothetical protein HBH93_135150 [Parastagonospora nodorum]KAH4458223.1 hypothetical protein HBH91_087190 [Parastagonospora nodorum]
MYSGDLPHDLTCDEFQSLVSSSSNKYAAPECLECFKRFGHAAIEITYAMLCSRPFKCAARPHLHLEL